MKKTKTLDCFNVIYNIEDEEDKFIELCDLTIEGYHKNSENLLSFLNSSLNPFGKNWRLLENCGLYQRFVSGYFDIKKSEIIYYDGGGNPEKRYFLKNGVLRQKREFEIHSYSFFDLIREKEKLAFTILNKNISFANKISHPILKFEFDEFLEGLLNE